MRVLSTIQKQILLIDAFILIFCLLGLFNIISKSDLPFQISALNNNIIIESIDETENVFKENDIILSIDGYELQSKEEVEIFLDGINQNKALHASILRDNDIIDREIVTVNYYSLFYSTVAGLVGVLFFLVAIIVLIKCDRKEQAGVLHWSFILTAVIILMTWGNYSLLPLDLGKATRIGFHIGYLFAPVFFLKFSVVFPSRLKMDKKYIFIPLFCIAAVFSFLLSISFLQYTFNTDVVKLRQYIFIFDISSVFIILIIITAILIFLYTYVTTKIETDRKKMRWILMGFFIGPLGYLIFWVIPTRIWNQAPLPESLVLLLVAFVPITFGIAIIKYRLMNVDIIFKRGLVYSSVLAGLLTLYIIILSIAAKLINNPDSEVASIIAAISIAILFQPAKTRVQKFVDKKFFRIAYDYRLALNLFNKEIKGIHNSNILINKVLELIGSLIPLEKYGFFWYDEEENKLILENAKGFNPKVNSEINISQNINPHQIVYPVTSSNNVEPGITFSNDQFSILDEINTSLIFGVKSSKQKIYGFLILGEKKSDTNYTAEDIDLLNIIITRVGLTLDRIRLQEEVVREHLETERLEELNRLKSFFVSSVSHDLKTPLTSIKLFSERLRSSDNISREKTNEYLEIIEGESDRLTRLINNVLDYSKIERGTQNYNLQKINIVETVKKVLKSMEYQFKIAKFKLHTDFEQDELLIIGDEDAASEALVNLLSNALKFSRNIKEIDIRVYQNNKYAVIDVKDSGEGISSKDIENIFEPYFRAKNDKIVKTGGAGLGLAIVKHIMDGHSGLVDVKSMEGKGSTFSLQFPIWNESDECINN